MVNINLNQEDSYKEQSFKDKEQSFKEDDSFQQTLNIESHDFADDRGEYRSEIPEFPKSSSNSRIYILAGGLLVVVIFIVYLLYPRDSGIDADLAGLAEQDIIETPIDEDLSTTPPSTEETDFQQQPEENFTDLPQTEPSVDLSSLAPLEREARISSYLGKLSVDGVTNALSNRAIFTLIRFSSNSLLIELVAGSEPAISEITEDIRLNTGAEIRVLSQESTSIQGRSVVKALLSGTVSIESAPGTINAIFDSTPDISSWVRTTAQSAGLAVSNLAVSSGGDASSIMVNLQGSLTGVLGFLNAFEAIAANILVEKISLINNDHSASSDNSVSLVMVMKQF